MHEIMRSCEVLVHRKELLSLSGSFDTRLRVLVLKKLPNLKSIYSGRLQCNFLEEITMGDCPQLTRIPITISHSFKKIEADPERTQLSIFEDLASYPQEDALHS
jgi:disease resistance protein RPS2